MATEDILVLAPDAGEYLPWLKHLPCTVHEARNVAEARQSWCGQAVVLGQPDLVAELLDNAPGLRWVQSTWAGVTPLLDSPRRDYLLTGVKGVFGREMAEYVLGYLLAWELKLLERLGRQANRSWWPEPSGTLDGKTVCVLGTGSIGRDIASALKPFGVRLLGYSRSGRQVEPFEMVFEQDQLAHVLSQADYLVCVLPDTPETQGLMGKEALSALPSRACVFNVGRGSLFAEQELADALNSGRLAGAVLDVFREEPLPPDHTLWHAQNTLITAHVAARSWPREISALFVENYHRYVQGEPLLYRIDFERGY